MQRFFLTQDAFDGENVCFSKSISHQIMQVMRMDLETGSVAVINPEGQEFLVKLNGQANGIVNGIVLGPLPAREEPKLKLVLCFSLSRREKVELILQKCTEIGVSAFQPFISSRSLVQDLEVDAKRTDRWNAIIREACEQAHRQHIPELRSALTLERLLQEANPIALKFLAWEESPLVDRLTPADLVNSGEQAHLLIGPEGGLSLEEVTAAKDAGWRVISLGKSILRMETACIAGSAIAIYLGEGD